jgi:SAM-dependent methyltransferase
LANVSLLLADAQTERLQPGRFDLLVSRFGVMFFADPAAAFQNLLGACRPGGRLCFVCWSALAENPHWQAPFEVVVRHLGPPSPKPLHAPGPLAFSDADYVRGILDKAGFERVGIAREAVDIIGSTPEKEAAVACMMGPSGALLDEHNADGTTRRAIQQEMAEAFARYESDGPMLMPATVLVVEARKPR